MKNPLLASRLKRAALALALAAALPLSAAPAAMASESEPQFVYAEECPEGYRGVIVGYDHPKWGNNAVYACTNI